MYQFHLKSRFSLFSIFFANSIFTFFPLLHLSMFFNLFSSILDRVFLVLNQILFYIFDRFFFVSNQIDIMNFYSSSEAEYIITPTISKKPIRSNNQPNSYLLTIETQIFIHTHPNRKTNRTARRSMMSPDTLFRDAGIFISRVLS